MGGTRGWGSHNKRRLFIVASPTLHGAHPGLSLPGATHPLGAGTHSLGYPPAHRVSFASAGIRTRHQELKVLREASLLPTELLAQLVAGMLP